MHGEKNDMGAKMAPPNGIRVKQLAFLDVH